MVGLVRLAALCILGSGQISRTLHEIPRESVLSEADERTEHRLRLPSSNENIDKATDYSGISQMCSQTIGRESRILIRVGIGCAGRVVGV